jgi:myosin-5
MIYSKLYRFIFELLQALLQTERQATEAAKREHADSERRNEELIKKFEGADKKMSNFRTLSRGIV